jgi:NTE family protein
MFMDIALALGGGGAKGNAHIGVLRRLEREGYRVRALAGTSFGSLVGLMYAAGFSPDQIEMLFSEVDQDHNHLYRRDGDDGPALMGLSGVRRWLTDILGEKTFADLHIPAAVTAVDAKSGREIILTEGRLKDAILGSIALPGIFPPYPLSDWELIDGGVLNPVPVSAVRHLAPGLPVVAVVLNDPLDKPVPTYTIPVPRMLPRSIIERITRMNFAQSFDIFMRAVDLSSRAVAHYRLLADAPDVIIRPHIHHIELLDEVNVHEVARLGEDAVERVLPELARATSWITRMRRKFAGAMQ